MVFKNLCILVLWTKLLLEGLSINPLKTSGRKLLGGLHFTFLLEIQVFSKYVFVRKILG